MNAVSRSSEGKDSLKKIKIKILIDWTTKQAHQLLYATRRTISAPERKAYIMYWYWTILFLVNSCTLVVYLFNNEPLSFDTYSTVSWPTKPMTSLMITDVFAI